MRLNFQPILSSFRDPDGQLYILDGQIYRHVTKSGYSDYKMLMESGLYERLTSLGYLISHEDVTQEFIGKIGADHEVMIKPEKVDTISYPYEWCFSQMKDAALLTLEIVKISLEYGMVLKDATAFNIQMHRGKPILIDTCSFEKYSKNSPWVAYHQFCKHFLGPVALMAKKDIRLGKLFLHFIDGIPVDLTSKLLPFNSWLSFSLLAHIHIHAISQKRYGDSSKTVSKKTTVSEIGLLGLIDNLETCINKLCWRPKNTEWGDYYDKTNYSNTAALHKATIVQDFVDFTDSKKIWDLGGNNGHYSRIAMKGGASVVSWDIDPVAVEANYRKSKMDASTTILPLIQDLTNPSANVGWSHKERDSLQARGPVDLILALALIHHIAITNNVPLERIAEYFSTLGRYLVIEFVPKEDSQVKRLLNNRKDIFSSYDVEGFKSAFSKYYKIIKTVSIDNSCRTVYLMDKRINNDS